MKQCQSIKKERKRFKAQRKRRLKRLKLLGFNVKDLLDELPFYGENSGPPDKVQASGEAAESPKEVNMTPVPDPAQNLIKVERIDLKQELIGSPDDNETRSPDGPSRPTNNFINAEANAVKRDSSDHLNDNETVVPVVRRMTARSSCRGFKYELSLNELLLYHFE